MAVGKSYEIFVGMSDAVTHEQIFSSEAYISLLKKICEENHVAFSFSEIRGGYIHDDGTMVEENSLQLRLIDVDENTTMEIARELCLFFHQESVLVTEQTAKMCYVRGSINFDKAREFLKKRQEQEPSP